MHDIRNWINLVETNTNLQRKTISRIIATIDKCRSHFGENVLFYGNCGIFAIALTKWVSTQMSLRAGLAGVVVVFKDDPNPLPMLNVNIGRSFTHVFSSVIINGKEYLFDGSGKVSAKTLESWYKQAHDGFEPDDHDDPDEFPEGIELVKGELNERCMSHPIFQQDL